jgi:hypothetical protein
VVDITSHIREQLPDQQDSIDRLAGKDGEFLVLCDDFDACVDALQYWASSEEPGAQARVSEYRDLIGALFEEITHILEDYEKRRQE